MAVRRAMAAGFLVVAFLWCRVANAETDCTVQFNAMQPCIEYVNSKDLNAPSKECCVAFKATQVNSPVCLCQLQQAFSDPATAPGNITRANQIPSLCAVAVDPSRCPALLGLAPATAPAVAPPAATPAVTPIATPVTPPVATPVATPAAAPPVVPASSPVPAGPTGGDVDCTNEFNSLANCVAYVSSNETAPSTDCCSALLSVHTQKPVCLCQLLQQVNSGDPSMTAGLNVTKALELPAVCKVNADVNSCPALLGQPVSSPVESPLTAAPGPEYSAPTPDAGAPVPDAAPEESPAVSGPAGNAAHSILGAPISTNSILVGFAALTLHFVL